MSRGNLMAAGHLENGASFEMGLATTSLLPPSPSRFRPDFRSQRGLSLPPMWRTPGGGIQNSRILPSIFFYSFRSRCPFVGVSLENIPRETIHCFWNEDDSVVEIVRNCSFQEFIFFDECGNWHDASEMWRFVICGTNERTKSIFRLTNIVEIRSSCSFIDFINLRFVYSNYFHVLYIKIHRR